MTEIELFSFPRLTEDEIKHIEEFFGIVSLLPIDSSIARLAGAVRRNYGLKIADSAIAATALFTGTRLITENRKDFKRIPNLLLAET